MNLMPRPFTTLIRYFLISCLSLFITAQHVFSQTLTKEQIEQLKFRHVGPIGNRITCAIGIAGNDLVYFAGAATGGIWKTVDGGLNWKPVFDDKPVHAIGALAAAASDTQLFMLEQEKVLSDPMFLLVMEFGNLLMVVKVGITQVLTILEGSPA